MSEVASCFFGTCDVCASRHIDKNEFTEYCCQGGYDHKDFTYIMPCETCIQRMAPATQDLDEYYLHSILFGDDSQTDINLFGDLNDDRMDSILFGDDQAQQDLAQQVFQDIIEEQKDHWPRVNLPLVEERMVEDNGRPRRVRVYKPFQRIQSSERDDFKQFLQMIF